MTGTQLKKVLWISKNPMYRGWRYRKKRCAQERKAPEGSRGVHEGPGFPAEFCPQQKMESIGAPERKPQGNGEGN